MTGTHRRAKRTTTTDDYAAMLRRMITAYGTRIGSDPAEGLTHLRDLEQAMTDSANYGLYMANKVGGRSINQLADMLGVSKQAIFKRVGQGELVARKREQRQLAVTQARRAPGTGQLSLPGGVPEDRSLSSPQTSDQAVG